MISIGTIGLIKAVDTLTQARAAPLPAMPAAALKTSCAWSCAGRGVRGETASLQEPLEADGQLTLADTLPDEGNLAEDCESRADAARLRALVDTLPRGSEPSCGCGTAWAASRTPNSRPPRSCTSAAAMFPGWKSGR